MTIKKTESGSWQVDIQPGGRSGKRIRKTFKLKADALGWERHIQAEVQEKPDWTPAKRDGRRLLDLLDIWVTRHGVTLRAGEDTANRLRAMCLAMGNPVADKFNGQDFADYRASRLESGVNPNTMNRELRYLKAMFNSLIAMDIWMRDNPLSKFKDIKTVENELSFLPLEDIGILLDSLKKSKNPHVVLLTKLCLATGARWGEAEMLTIQQLSKGTVTFARTKSGKIRGVPVDSAIESAIREHHEKYGCGNRVFQSAFSAFREGVERARVVLPKGQLTHVLRHTFASHFMMAGGNILTLQKILGHQSLAMTMRYAHLAPDHLKEAKEFNPLALVKAKTNQAPLGAIKSDSRL